MAKQKTVVGLRGDMTVNEKPVYIEAVFGDEVLLRIAEEFSFGSPISVTYWLKEKWGLQDNPSVKLLILDDYKTGKEFNDAWNALNKKQEVQNKVIANLRAHGIPEPAVQLMATALLAEVLVTDLLFQYKSEKTEEPKREAEKVVKLGLAIKFGMPLNLLPGIEINKISLLVKSAPEARFAEVFSPNAPQLLPEPAPLPGKKEASGYIEFSKVPDATSKITLDGEDWTFVTTAPNDGNKRITTIVAGKLEDTVKKLAEDLNKVTSPHIGACDYSCAAADGAPANYRLEIQHKTPGAQGNRFEWIADAKANATASKGALTGGVSPEGELACGFVEFQKGITKDAPIEIFGVQLKFPDAAAEDVQVPAAVTKLVEVAKNADGVLNQYNFQASGNRLDFAAKQVGEQAGAKLLPDSPPAFVGKQSFYRGANKVA
jgi:hypothetical protein